MILLSNKCLLKVNCLNPFSIGNLSVPRILYYLSSEMATKSHLFPRRRLAVSLTMPRSLKNKILLLRLSWNSCVTIVSRKSRISPPDIINPLAVSFQANGKKRLILVLRHINFHVYKQKFKCGNLHTIKNTFAKDFFFFVFSFDLKSVYHHVDIFPDHRKYLALSWEFAPGHTRFFQFTVLPFGLSSAPYIFTKLIKPLETHISRYVFGINHEKSNWEPSLTVSWIGYNIDTHTGLIFTSNTGILESFALILMKFVLVWSFLPLFT